MTIDTERLKKDAAYWDECGAPDDAKYYVPESEDYLEGWLRPYPDNRNDGMQFKHINGDKWINNSCADKNCIPRPTKPAAPEWDGEGEMPIPCRCEVRHPTDIDKWFECDVIARRFGYIWWRPDTNDIGREPYLSMFRPIRTSEQRQREEVDAIIRKAYLDGASGHIGGLAAITDAILSRYNLEPKP